MHNYVTNIYIISLTSVGYNSISFASNVEFTGSSLSISRFHPFSTNVV